MVVCYVIVCWLRTLIKIIMFLSKACSLMHRRLKEWIKEDLKKKKIGKWITDLPLLRRWWHSGGFIYYIMPLLVTWIKNYLVISCKKIFTNRKHYSTILYIMYSICNTQNDANTDFMATVWDEVGWGDTYWLPVLKEIDWKGARDAYQLPNVNMKRLEENSLF